ncbi:nucleophile aminohydrolase [Lobosporangium transversale]|uniref:Nucleophile aminohydrolase n=1 Tax=Lobosporangium transversale TaxID=64571 RepID=A0A1Y2GI97_9FUNG|nr:nucleophile aminohydrolase [Lobosporangium transversale]ORZ10583.1 nucleophile aminohydrolase [Lobosporangium transversale]|eukprot:XP_021879304.1 nucleophile aminohydrolase [Lobosporangium transversale]
MLLYKGRQPIQLAHLLTKPAHSIINQSFDSKRPVDGRRLINGDGFGVGWYEPESSIDGSAAPCIFTSVTPAWNNMNLIRLANKIKSPLVFAHVRAAAAGSVSESNCHPWQYGRLMFMHHGMVSDFHLIKRRLQESLSDEIFLSVNGNTDSEWAFAVFLSQLQCPRQCEPFGHETLKEAMLNTIRKFNMWFKSIEKTANNGLTPSMLNFAVTDGVSVVCTRYINSSSAALEPERLYFSSGTRFECYKPGHYRMVKEAAKVKREDIVMIASEPLTFEETDWRLVSRNTLVVITGRMNVLMYPIKDDYYGSIPVAAVDSITITFAFTFVADFASADLIHSPNRQHAISRL